MLEFVRLSGSNGGSLEKQNGELAKLRACNEKLSKTRRVEGKFQMEHSCFCGLCNFVNSQRRCISQV